MWWRNGGRFHACSTRYFLEYGGKVAHLYFRDIDWESVLNMDNAENPSSEMQAMSACDILLSTEQRC
jgi:hypothetical protein